MQVAQPSAAVKTATMLALLAALTGCTPLTNDVPDPTGAAVGPTQSEVSTTPKAVPKMPKLAPGEGETLRGTLSSKGDLTGTTVKLEKAETSVLWSCVGDGTFSYTLGDVSATSGECGETDPVKIRQNSFPVTESQELSLQVGAQAGQEWALIVIQKSDQ